MAEHSNHIAVLKENINVNGEHSRWQSAPSTSYGVFVGLKTTVEFCIKGVIYGTRGGTSFNYGGPNWLCFFDVVAAGVKVSIQRPRACRSCAGSAFI